MPKQARKFQSALALGITDPAQILAFHRRTFGDTRMEDAGAGDGAAGGDAGASGDAAAGAGDQGGQQQDADKDKAAGDGKVEDLPEWAQKAIRDARADAGKARTSAKQQAADDAKAELAQTIGKALGLVKDDKEQVDPAALTAQLTTAQQAQRESAAELVVWRNHAELKVDAQAVTDSRAFARAIADLDPSSKTFEADVKKAAQEAAENNPKLKATQAAGKSSVEHAGGSGEDGNPASRAQPGQPRLAAAYANSGS